MFGFIKKIFHREESMQMQKIDPLAETELALEASKQRVAKANQAILHFRQLHQVLINGQWAYVDENLSNRASLDCELRGLFLEADEAVRFYGKAQQDYSACRPRHASIGSGKLAQG